LFYPPSPPRGAKKKILKILLKRLKIKSMKVFKVPPGGFRGENIKE
jgi:hypothetical protein